MTSSDVGSIAKKRGLDEGFWFEYVFETYASDKGRKNRNLGPRRKRMQRPARLQAAVMWRAGYGGNNIVRGYARWFGVDLLCAIVELRLLGIAVDEQHEQQLRRTVAARAAARARHGADKLAVERQPLEIDWPIEWLPDDESVVSSADEIPF